MSDWISVNDRLPEDNQVVTCYLGEHPGRWWSYITTRYANGQFHFGGMGRVTHWYPVLEPPIQSDHVGEGENEPSQ